MVKKAAAKAPLKVSKPRTKAGGLGVKKMTTKVDDSVFEQAPAEPVIIAPAPHLVRALPLASLARDSLELLYL